MQAVDLHRRPTARDVIAPDDEEIWKSAERKTVGDTRFFIPSPAELFLQTCVHAMSQNHVAGIRWIVDAFEIAKRRPDDLVRGRPSQLAQERGVTALLSAAVRHLKENYRSHASLAAIERDLVAIRPEPFELGELRLLESDPELDRLYYQKLNWYGYIRLCRRTKRPVTALGFLKYYRWLWGEPSLPRVMGLLVKKSVLKLRG